MSAAMLINRIGRRLGIDFLVAGALLLGTCGSAHSGTEAPSLIGHYSNQVWSKDADPHALSGYALQLYKQGDVIFGGIGVAVGSPEPVRGKLYDISFDEKAKTISFKAKYSEGIKVSRDTPPEGKDAKIILTFTGKLSPRRVQGELIRQDGYPPFKILTKQTLVLRKSSVKFVPDSIDEWNQLYGN